ncbi:transcription factor bHLH118-like [Cryptomeria japonica]|uniref:transcription factor bHLH118-like n=1 Tax=Cryptomeria japonica TaxID=3369 RepID=UPI0027DAACFF|nr:transcription factor bHLH118-like [Cryptomeria japonica]
MSFYPNKEFDLSNFSSIPSQQEKTYQNTLDFYFQKSSEDGFGNPSSCNVGKMAGSEPNKQITHKLVERQRRKDMKSLYSELRSLLPEESIRGNRSVTDQLAEAANYVHYLQQQIKDLSEERDRTKTPAVFLKGVEISKPLEFQESDEGFPSIKIKSFGSAAFQVYINSIQNQIDLSDVLLVLEECRVEVVSAASSVNNGKVFHTIHAKVADHSITNVETLYVKLQQLIGYKIELWDDCEIKGNVLVYVFLFFNEKGCDELNCPWKENSDKTGYR